MTPAGSRHVLRTRSRRGALAVGLMTCFVGLIWSSFSVAQAPAASPVAKAAAGEQGTRWSELKPAQQTALKPLEREWSGIDGRGKRKWLELSARFSKLTPAEQGRVQERMSEWAKLTPRERGEARVNFQDAKQLPLEDRQARWKAYEALSPEQKEGFASRAARPSADATRKTPATNMPTNSNARRDPDAQAKSNIVPNPNFAAPPKSVAPTVTQARPGATTTLITRRPAPPSHQQTGMPKIAATPEFVDKATLLPHRGPQGAAANRSAAASAAGGAAPARQ
jgi:hypothetical protein